MIPHDQDPIDDRDLDLLVDGELDEQSRRELLARLDAGTDGWRRCALAFLEAQGFRQAVSAAAHELSTARNVARPPSSRRIAGWSARAAMILLAFGLGWLMHAPVRRSARERPTVAATPSAPVATGPTSKPSAPSPEPPAPRLAAAATKRPVPLGYVQGHLEREGYRVEQRLFLVPAAMRDGRRVAVPVERVQLRFVGNRTI